MIAQQNQNQTVQLLPGEAVIWSNHITHGVWHKTHEVEYITNFRVGLLAPDRGIDAQMTLSEIMDVVVINQHWVSTYQHTTFYTGYYTRMGVGSGYGGGRMVGDLEVLNHQGQPQLIFEQIADPANIKSLIKTEMKHN